MPDIDTLGERLREAGDAYRKAKNDASDAYATYKNAQARCDVYRRDYDTLAAESVWGLRIGDIIEWDVEAERRFRDWGYTGKVIPAHSEAMKVTEIDGDTIVGLMLTKDGKVGKREERIYNFSTAKYRIRKGENDA